MDMRISGKNLTVTSGMREHTEEKLSKLEKYAPRLVEAHVVLMKEKYVWIAEITLLAKNFRHYGEGQSKENVFSAIDQAYTRIEKQLKKFREKVKDHRKTDGVLKSLKESGEAVRSAQKPRIVKAKSFAGKPMSIQEASLQLKVSSESFLVFQNASTQRVNVIFKKNDGNHGLIEPEF